jgi:predicted ArsR family transcriptional regulator
MTQQDSGRDRLGRRAKRFLSPSQKYELWLQLVTGELSQSEAAERFGIDRSTVMRIRQVAKQGALEALAASKPGCGRPARTPSWPRPGRRYSGWARRSRSRRSS